jgi:hypothetical protein
LILTGGGGVSVKKRNTVFVLFALLSVVLGAGGIRALMDIQVPIFITAVCVYFWGKNTALNRKAVLLGGAGLVLCAAGYAVNFVLHFFYNFHSHHGASTIDLSGIFFQKLGDLLYNFIVFLGYTANAKFMSPPGIFNFVIVIAAFVIFYEAVKIIKNRRGGAVSSVNVSFMMFFIVSIVYHIILIQILDETSTRYMIPVQVLYIPALAVIFEFVKKSMTQRKAAIFITVITFVLTCNSMIKLYFLPEGDSTVHRKDSISYLEENNLRFGFASFWNANVITELTNGRIETLSLDPDDYHKINVWLYPLAYKDPGYHKGETFLLLTYDEWLSDEVLSSRVPDYRDDNFVIFRYPSASRVFEELITGD